MAFVKGFVPFDLKQRGEWENTLTVLGEFLTAHGVDLSKVAQDAPVEICVDKNDYGHVRYTHLTDDVAPNGESLMRYINELSVGKIDMHTFATLKESYFLITDDNEKELTHV